MSLAKEFGAVGDGQADDSAALQHAVDKGDGVLELSKGNYRITRPIVLDFTKHGYLGVRGDQGTSTVVMDGAGPALKLVGDHQGTAQPDSVKPHTWSGERMPIVSGLEILGRHEQADGIQLIRTMQATIQNTLIRQCRHGIHLAERNRNFVLSASHIYDCHDSGVFFDNCNLHQVIITGNHISYCKRAGLRQLNGDVHNIQITGNDIEYNSGADGTSGEIVLEAPDGVISEYTISGNTLQATLDASGANVLIIGKVEKPPVSVRLVNITGNVLGSRDRNVVIQNGSKISVTGNTIYAGTKLNLALTNCQNAVVGSNTIGTRPAGYNSTCVDGVLFEQCIGGSIVGNVLSDCQFGGEDSGGCVTLRQCRAVMVSCNQVLDAHVLGIDIQDSSRCHVASNSVSEERGLAKMLCAIRVTGKSHSNVVQNNLVTKGKNTDIDCDEKFGEVRGNTILNDAG